MVEKGWFSFLMGMVDRVFAIADHSVNVVWTDFMDVRMAFRNFIFSDFFERSPPRKKKIFYINKYSTMHQVTYFLERGSQLPNTILCTWPLRLHKLCDTALVEPVNRLTGNPFKSQEDGWLSVSFKKYIRNLELRVSWKNISDVN